MAETFKWTTEVATHKHIFTCSRNLKYEPARNNLLFHASNERGNWLASGSVNWNTIRFETPVIPASHNAIA